MSPERLVSGIARKPSDVYALGMTLYEAIRFYPVDVDCKVDNLSDICK